MRISLSIENTYEDGEEIITTPTDVEVPEPEPRCSVCRARVSAIARPGDDPDHDWVHDEDGEWGDHSAEGPDWGEWDQDHIMPLTGTGRTDGDSWYDVTVTSSDRPDILPIGQTFDFGY